MRKFPFAISAVSNPRVSKVFFFALAVSLATLRIFDENGHKSGRQTCSFFRALPESEALRFCACRRKNGKKQKKRGPRFSFKTPFFSFKTPSHQAPKIFVQNPKIFVQNPKIFVQNLDYGAFLGVAQPFLTRRPKLIPDHPQTLKSSDGPSSQPDRETRGCSKDMRLIFSC